MTEKVYSLAPTVTDFYNKKHSRLYGTPNNYTCADFFNNLASIIVDKKGIADFLMSTMNGDYQSLADFFIINHNAVPNDAPVIGGWLENQTTINMPRLMGTHSPAAYLSWMSCSEDELFQFEHKYKESLTDCPVDVYVYDENGFLVASIVDETVVVNKLAAYVEDGTKIIHMPNDQEYRVEIKATDSGTVDYSVKEYSIDKDENTVRTVQFDSIPVEAGDSLVGTVDEITYTDAVNYALTINESETILPSEDSHHCASKDFIDVDLSKWYHEGIDYAVITGMMNGVGDGLFNPDGTTTRGMIVTILHRLEGEPTAKASAFRDVQSGSWYENAVNWASQNGIVTGTSSSTFAPNTPVTREQLATILYRYAQYKQYDSNGKADLSMFKDSSSVSSYAMDGVSWAVNAGLINGVGDNMLSPSGSATRVQVATILMRFSESIARGY